MCNALCAACTFAVTSLATSSRSAVVCIFIDGQVDGDAIAIGGRIESNRNSKISGKAVAFGGYVNRQPDSVIAGNSESFAYLLIPGQYRPTLVGSITLAIINVLFVAFGYLIVRAKRAETASLAIERRPASVFFTGIVSLAIFYGLDWLTRYLGHAEIVAVIVLLLLLAAVAATGATGLGDWVARLAFPQTRGIWACIGGVLALSLLELIPLVGSLVFIIGLIVSLGASVVTRFGSQEVSGAGSSAEVNDGLKVLLGSSFGYALRPSQEVSEPDFTR